MTTKERILKLKLDYLNRRDNKWDKQDLLAIIVATVIVFFTLIFTVFSANAKILAGVEQQEFITYAFGSMGGNDIVESQKIYDKVMFEKEKRESISEASRSKKCRIVGSDTYKDCDVKLKHHGYSFSDKYGWKVFPKATFYEPTGSKTAVGRVPVGPISAENKGYWQSGAINKRSKEIDSELKLGALLLYKYYCCEKHGTVTGQLVIDDTGYGQERKELDPRTGFMKLRQQPMLDIFMDSEADSRHAGLKDVQYKVIGHIKTYKDEDPYRGVRNFKYIIRK